MRGSSWSPEENDATIDAYFRLYDRFLRGEPVSKAKAYRELHERFPRRTAKAFERKMQNVSACLERLDLPWIEGLLPARNFQGQLLEQIVDRLGGRRDLIASFAEGVPVVADAPMGRPDQLVVEAPVDPSSVREPRAPVVVDYAAREAANRLLGRAGEIWVLELERNALSLAGRDDLADKVEHVSVERGDGLGYDVLSFDPKSGRDRWIEVKTTRAGMSTPFFLSPNELAVSKREAERYALYRVHQFGARTRYYALYGDLADRCRLEPSSYRAWPVSA